MTRFGKPGTWQRAMMVATGIGVFGASLAAPLAEAATMSPQAGQAIIGLQTDGQPQPSQVGEGDADTETLDQGSPPASQDNDVETLDQGPAPITAGAVPVPVTDGTVLAPAPVAAPAATDMAYAEPAGPRLPPGFGEGRVLVSNSSRGFPVGLEPCQVGVVSGRAYVGVKCGDSSGPVVGHSTYDNFPWVVDPGFPFRPGAAVVTDPSFPFDENSPFYESFLDRTSGSDVVVLVAPRSFPFTDDNANASSTDAPIVTKGGVVSLTQPARTGKERNQERTRGTGSASSGDVSSDPGKSRTRRAATKKQRASVSSESKRGKDSGANTGKSAKDNKNKDRKNAKKASKKQRAASEKHQKRHRHK